MWVKIQKPEYKTKIKKEDCSQVSGFSFLYHFGSARCAVPSQVVVLTLYRLHWPFRCLMVDFEQERLVLDCCYSIALEDKGK